MRRKLCAVHNESVHGWRGTLVARYPRMSSVIVLLIVVEIVLARLRAWRAIPASDPSPCHAPDPGQ